MTITSLLSAAFVAGILALDNVQIMQWMLSRPIVSGTIIGAILGDTATGMLCGAWIELIWLGVLPIGNYTPPDAHITAVCSAVAAHAWGGSVSAAVLATSCCVPIGIISRKFDHLLRIEISAKMEEMMKKESPFELIRLVAMGILPIFLKAFFAVLITGIAGYILVPAVTKIISTDKLMKALEFSATLIPALGMVQLARCIGAKSRKTWLAAGAIFSIACIILVKMS